MGTAEPGQTIRLTGSADQQMLITTADAGGHWKITLHETPRLYTRFEILALNPDTGVSSAAVRFIFGGTSPKFSGLYASRTLAFGHGRPGEKVTVYGPKGQVLGQSFVFTRLGIWTVKFQESVTAGDRLCVLAEASDGSTSMPFFVKAVAFSVDSRNVGRIAGSGAEPGDRIQLFDTMAGQAIATTIASDAGGWAVSFHQPLETGKRIAVQRTHLDGATSQGPVFTAIKNDCLAPVINTCSGNQLGGMAEPGLQVSYAQYRNSQMIRNGSVGVEASGLWTSSDANVYQPFDFQTGDVLVAKTENSEGTQVSLIPSCVTIGGNRPGAPLVMHIDQNGAWGYAERLKNVIISTEDEGLIWVARSGWDGYWSADWTPAVGTLPTTTRVLFEVLDSWRLTNDAQTSIPAIRYADAAASVPEIPVIDTYIPSDIAGIETTPGTAVVVHNRNNEDQAINPGGAPVTAGRWEVKPTGSDVPKDGDEVYAVAWTLENGHFGVNSGQSPDVQISAFVPPEPVVTRAFPDDVKGTEQITDPADQAMTRILISPKADANRTPVGISPHLSSLDWEITPDFTLTVGEAMVAWAQTDAGAKSPEADFIIEAAAKPQPPVIGDYISANVNGSGTYATTVSLSLNEQVMGTSVVQSDLVWTVNTGKAPVAGDKLKAIATDSSGNSSDPFYIIAGQAPTTLTVDAVTMTAVTASVTTDNQRLLAWRQSDGMKVLDGLMNGPGRSTVSYLAGARVEADDVVSISAQDTASSPTEGTMTHFDGKPVGYVA
nr:Ig-like domain-containing protein [Marinicella sp. W31]MDC2879884.1 hypothetical protein [Marinicella sp. W31]